METRAHHVLIGAFAILVFVLGAGFVLWLSKTSQERAFKEYDVIFVEAVTGLSQGGAVQYNGIKVGEVSQLKLAPDDPRKVIARIRVGASTPIKQDTRAKLALAGVTGVAFIQLSGGMPNSPNLEPTRDHPVPVIQTDPSALSQLLNSGEDIVTSINDALYRIGQLLSQENVDRVAHVLDNVDKIVDSVAGQREELSTALRQLSDATGDLKTSLRTVSELATTTNKLVREDARDLMASAEKAIGSIDRVAESVSGLVENNRAAIDSFGNQGLRQVGPTLAELRETLRAFKQLSDRLAKSESLLLGSDQPKEYSPR
ncbi:MAG: MCE family protein [Dokdonella sp.]|jgi:phospholipid/cholesterol/gamma-HCH transport system substrate-binding protein|nr:MCE family protein [Dokdonella sp.]